MMQPTSIRPIAGGVVLAALSLLLAACLLMPGKFAADLDIRKDGRFNFHYAGEMYFLPLSKQAEEDDKAFEPAPCYNDDQTKERPCTSEELASQKSDWEQEQANAAERRKQEAKSAAAFLGGIDPEDPRGAEELAKRLRHQAGWHKVIYKGNGLFDVDFALAGRLDRDFTFPTMERFPMANAFVQLSLRQDGTVRVDAPGFGPASSGSPFDGMMRMAAMGGGAGDKDGKADTAPTPVIDGTFTITTDSEILANNTDEGPQTAATGKQLQWKVTPRSTAAPMALFRLTR